MPSLMSSIAVALLAVAACGGKKQTPFSEFKSAHAAQIDAIRTNLPRATAAATAAGAKTASPDCEALHLVLNGKKHPGNAEILWADEAADVLAGAHPDPTERRHLVPRPDAAGYCQLLDSSMYWLAGNNDGARELEKSGIDEKVGGWIESALGLTYAIVLVPGDSVRGQQDIDVRVVELATGTVKCTATVSGHADAKLGVEYYDTIRKDTGEKVGGPIAHDAYASAMKGDLVGQLRSALIKQLHVDLSALCEHPE